MISEKQEVVSLGIVENTIGGKVTEGLIEKEEEPVEAEDAIKIKKKSQKKKRCSCQ